MDLSRAGCWFLYVLKAHKPTPVCLKKSTKRTNIKNTFPSSTEEKEKLHCKELGLQNQKLFLSTPSFLGVLQTCKSLYKEKTKPNKQIEKNEPGSCCKDPVLQEQHSILPQMKNSSFTYLTHRGLILTPPRAHTHPWLWSTYSWLCLFLQKLWRENARFADAKAPILWHQERATSNRKPEGLQKQRLCDASGKKSKCMSIWHFIMENEDLILWQSMVMLCF